MSLMSRSRLVNPRLGTYFGIFVSALSGLVLLLIIFEQLGTPDALLRWVMLIGPLLLYAAIAASVFTKDPIDFFVVGRRVPAGYTGLGIASSAMGATGIVAMTGVFFIIGFDALFIVIGGLAGLVLMAVMLAPFLRKFGMFTVPSYLGRRFDSRSVRILCAALIAVPMLLLLAAELRIGAFVAAWLVGQPQSLMVVLMTFCVVLGLVFGGMRSFTWTSSAQAIAAILALIVPVAVVAVMTTNFPLPQLTHGPLLRELVRNEVIHGVPIVEASSFAFMLPGDGMLPMAKRFTEPFGNVGPAAFVVAMLTVAAGVASAPWLLPRVTMTPGVYETRKSLGWATVFFSLVMLTVASVSVFMRDYVMDIVAAAGSTTVPDWLQQLTELGFAQIDTSSTRLVVASFSFWRDTVFLSLPIAAGLPNVFAYFAAAGAVAAALVAAGAVVGALGNVIAEDVINGLSWEPLPSEPRVWVARIAFGVVAILGGSMALVAPTDALSLLLTCLALTGSTLFPVLALSIWWKRMNAFGAMAGLASGFGVAVVTMLAGSAIGLDGALAGLLGIPASVLGTILASLATPAPTRSVLELVREMRVPGGEVIYDREMRMLRLKNRDRK
ncbi:MAG: sodium:solute symporter [Hyphomicrobiaceae bacterium]|nr:sodium:solute symporter [Hyphomicrobiaceae bacterium]